MDLISAITTSPPFPLGQWLLFAVIAVVLAPVAFVVVGVANLASPGSSMPGIPRGWGLVALEVVVIAGIVALGIHAQGDGHTDQIRAAASTYTEAEHGLKTQWDSPFKSTDTSLAFHALDSAGELVTVVIDWPGDGPVTAANVQVHLDGRPVAYAPPAATAP